MLEDVPASIGRTWRQDDSIIAIEAMGYFMQSGSIKPMEKAAKYILAWNEWRELNAQIGATRVRGPKALRLNSHLAVARFDNEVSMGPATVRRIAETVDNRENVMLQIAIDNAFDEAHLPRDFKLRAAFQDFYVALDRVKKMERAREGPLNWPWRAPLHFFHNGGRHRSRRGSYNHPNHTTSGDPVEDENDEDTEDEEDEDEAKEDEDEDEAKEDNDAMDIVE